MGSRVAFVDILDVEGAAFAAETGALFLRCDISDIAALQASTAAVLIDVREDREWNAGHATQATHVARGVIERDIEKLVPDPATPLYLYCGGGFRSILSADSLQQMGYTNVHSVIGGWRGWQEQGAPITMPRTDTP
jgi:rhodanese-related sulfurtransferase